MKIFRLLVACTLTCFALSPSTRAVLPAPNGGYPGGNTAEGQSALFSLTTGGYNTAVGYFSLMTDTNGSYNTAIGAGSLFGNSGSGNTASGAGTLTSNLSGGHNVATGYNALFSNTTGFENTADGFSALFANTTGHSNTACGSGALRNNMTGRNNTALGYAAGAGVTTANNVICLGYKVAGSNVSNTTFIANIRGVTTQEADAVPVLIDSYGQLGTASSSARFKKDIEPISKASESILSLKPVSFRYKVHKNSKPQFGLIAEDVAQVNPDLVIYDADGKPYTVRYDAVNAMLLNEFLKEHGEVQELKTTVVQQQKQIETLIAGLQKVSAQLELNKAAPQTVVNNQ
jgi:endosialidase-like protein